MRFDDMLSTLLAQPADDPGAREAQWSQLVDILAQGRGGLNQMHGYARLEELRSEVGAEAAHRTARALAGRELPPPLVAMFAQETPAIAGAVLSGARMETEDWLALLPSLGPTGRAFLRNRRDLPVPVREGLAAFGTTDFVIAGAIGPADTPSSAAAPVGAPGASPRPATPPSGPVAIGELVARIKAFREVGARADPVPPAREFRFETDREGVLRWIEGAPRAALVGETIGVAGDGDQGVDAHAAGAFRRRAPFRDARLTVTGDGAAAGEWRISAVPFFDPGDGRFIGFRGAGRRPRPDQTAAPGSPVPALLGTGMAPDSLRQLVHELRTPLNAIVGFAEMIDGQMLGPAALAYRARAGEIAEQGRRLIDAIDDLDTAARIDGRGWQAETRPVDLAAMAGRLLPAYRGVAVARGASLSCDVPGALPAAIGDAVAIERMIGRLLGAVAALGEGGETLAMAVGMAIPPGAIEVAIARPRALAGRDENALLDPGYSPEGEWPDAPLLGLGFTLRLVRSIAETQGGTLAIEAGRFLLRLPAEADSAAGSGDGG